MRLLPLALVAFFALAESMLAPVRCGAQEPGSAAWKQLQQNPQAWPAQVKLKAAVQLVIMKNGRQIGAISAPADSMVQVIKVEDSTLRVGVGSAQASVAPDQTDFADRLARAAATASTSTNTAPTAATAPSSASATNTPSASASTASSAKTGPLPPVSGPPLQFDYKAPDGESYRIAEYHFWSPAYTQPLRGMIIMTPGSDGDGRGMTDDPAWQALARKYSLGLVGSHLEGGHYQRPELGTGQTLRDALHHFADQSGHPEIATVPLLLWGMSAGGQWDYNYVLWKPAGVMAFVVNKGGYYNEDDADPATRAVPGLFILGQTDEDFRIRTITRLWTEGRSRGALWALTPQPNSGHEFSKTDPLARVFFEAVLKARLPDPNALTSDSPDAPTMKPMQENPGWLGNVTTHEIHDDSNDADIDRTAAWLPDESTAKAWKIFVSGG
jgi:dienelactone hydrolase